MPLWDRAEVARIIGEAFAAYASGLSARHAAGITAVPDEEDVPDGWGNADLLAEMRRAMADG